tara:strand:- start:136 stop:588 length:453 start_codon:yes stop_codon:yes gene_type:complete
MNLSEILTPGLIFTKMKSNKKDLCIKEIVQNLCLSDNDLNFNLVHESIIKRENLCSTALDNHIAIPHAKITGLNKTYCCLAINKNGIQFGSIDGKDTKIIILLLHPDSDIKKHLLILRNIATLFSSKEITERIINTSDNFEVFNIIKNNE